MANLQNWIKQADAHWKEFQPKRYAELKAARMLDAALNHAAEQTSLEMTHLRASGYNHQEAWEIVREAYLFPPEEGTKPSNDSPMWSAPTLTEQMMKAVASGKRTMPAPQTE